MDRGRPALVAEGLLKRFGDTTALDGFDLEVAPGTVHGLLGPNGAGKTTAVRIFATLLRLDGGRAEVAGCDLARRPAEVRRCIGLVGQHAAVDEPLSGRQNLAMFGRLFHLGGRAADRRADELLARFSLAEAADRPVKQYSGGMRRRLDLAASLILAPTVLLLDEPTTGLDPRGRNEVWTVIRDLVHRGTTVLLTTQHLDEADQLADRISLVDHGRVVAGGTPHDLKSRIGGDQVEVVLHRAGDLAPAAGVLQRVAGAEPEVDADARRIAAPARDGAAVLVELIRALDGAGLAVEDVGLRRPTLDEVFLNLTGRPA